MGTHNSGNRNEAADSRTPFKEILEVSGRLLIGLAGVCYVLGLIVVSIHLRGYGLNSLSLSQLHYVTAGVWVLLPIFLIVFPIVFLKFSIDTERDKWTNKSKLNKVKEIVPLVISTIILFVAISQLLGGAVGIQLNFVNWVLIPAFGALTLGILVIAVVSQIGPSGTRVNIWGSLGVAVVGTLLFMIYIVLFARHTYQEIPWATGGGRPSQVELIVESDAKPYLESVGIHFSGGSRTDGLKLLLATESEYFVINPKGETVSVRMDLVKSVIYEK